MKRVVSIFVAALFLTATASFAATANTGWISDAACGAKHMGTGAMCAKMCIGNGEKPVFVDAQKNVWKIDNPAVITKNFWGAHVTVQATEDAANKSMHIDSIAAAQ